MLNRYKPEFITQRAISLGEHQQYSPLIKKEIEYTTQRSTQPEYWGLHPKTQLISTKDI